jgi:hypothetical protein
MVRKIFITFLVLYAVVFCTKENPQKDLKIHIGDLISQKNLDFDYVEGNIIDCRNISVVYLKGDIRGNKNININVNIMKGNILSGNVKVNILDGNILNGKGVKINLLIGEDFSKEAEVLKKINKNIKF